MRILFLTPQLPYPPHQGTALRNYGLIAGLARRHQVSLLSFQETLGETTRPARETDLTPLTTLCQRMETVPVPRRTSGQRVLALFLSRRPDMALRLASPTFEARLIAWLAREPFDIVHIEGIEMAPYLPVVASARPRPLIVYDDHNCEYLLQKRAFLTDLRHPRRWVGAAYSFVQWQRLARFEAAVCRAADRVLAVSEPDAAMLRRLVPGLEPTVIPNGIDTARYRERVGEPEVKMGSAALVFTGKMDFRPNVDAVLWFAETVLPRVRAQVPEAHFVVVGQRPHRRLARLRNRPGITLTGWVADVRPYIARAAVYVAPLRIGGGTRLKLLEAMAMERAIVATRLGAEGFPVTAGRELLLADRPEAFAQAVVALLRDPARRAALGAAARAFVVRHYDWQVIIPRLEAVYG